jgi:quercetin dioxygenase-like cupin family protein
MKGEFRMKGYIKNIPVEEIFSLTDQVEYLPGQVVSRTISQNDAQSLTIFAFDKGEEISTHSSHGDAMITILDGEGRVTVDGKPFVLHKGESVLMPAGKPHSVFALEKFKMFLVVVFPLIKKDR